MQSAGLERGRRGPPLERFMNGRARTICRRGFTLLEVLLVVAIILIAAGLAIPSFIRSYRGAKLRTSARAVVMSHRYARAMAVLKQTDVAILYDAKKGSIEIISVGGAKQDDRAKFLEARDNLTGVAAADQQAAPAPAGPVVSELVRLLADGVSIVSFESDQAKQEKDGIYWVRYFKNGMCDKYTLRLKDEFDKSTEITVDPLSGKAKVEYE